MFESRFVAVDGWHLMLPLARQFSVIAADPRGVGLSDKPERGYDSTTLANDMVALMSALGHEEFAMAGHDIGMWGYAMAADHPERIERIALGGAIIPCWSPSRHAGASSLDRPASVQGLGFVRQHLGSRAGAVSVRGA